MAELQQYDCFIRNGVYAVPKHACPEAKGRKPTTGLTLFWVRNPVSQEENGRSLKLLSSNYGRTFEEF